MPNNDRKQIRASWPPGLQHHAATGDLVPRARFVSNLTDDRLVRSVAAPRADWSPDHDSGPNCAGWPNGSSDIPVPLFRLSAPFPAQTAEIFDRG
jgi:hypothetical protein